MAEKQVWIGSSGPFLFDDQDQYEDGETLQGFRGPQMLIENEPTSDKQVARQQTVTSQAEIDQRYSLMLS